MKIEILSLLEGARQAKGLAVIIDVFRAFSTAGYVLSNGADKIIAVGQLEEASALKKDNPGFILMGERGGKPLADFDYGNSPANIEHVDFSHKTVVQTTSAGTQGLVNAVNADEIITGSFVNAGAIADYIRAQNPALVSLVCMGEGAKFMNEEDAACARYLKNELEGQSNDFAKIRAELKGCPGARKFFDPAKTWAPERDFDLCLSLNRFDFVIKAEAQGRLLILRKVVVGRNDGRNW
jgi:2-phosphosulfolactate phosphatase